MKKRFGFLLALVMVFSLSVTAFAEGEQTGATTLTVTVPTPSYTLHIPANTTLTYGSTEKQKISGDLYVQNASRVYFLAPFTDLINTSDSSDSIALNLYVEQDHDGDLSSTVNQTTGKVDDATWALYDIDWPESWGKSAIETFYAQVTDWSGATPGATYQAVITFTVWAE